MKKVMTALLLIILSISICLFLSKEPEDNVKALKGIMNLNNYDFVENPIIKLDGQWELYENKLLNPEELKYEKSDKFLTIPSNDVKGQLDGQTTGYMTIRLKISVSDNLVYGLRIKRLFSASKVWVNGVLQGGAGRVGKNYEEEKAIYLPIYSYFTSQNGTVDIVIQTSNFRDIYPVIRSMEFGLKDNITNQLILDASIDLIIIGGLFVIELLFLSLYKHLKYNKSYLYFSILCLLMQLRCLILNERVVVHFFPNMPYELLSKTAALTYYLWLPLYVLFLKEIFLDMPKKIILMSSAFSIIFTSICIITNNTFYDRLSLLSEFILFIIVINVFAFLINKIKKGEKNSKISLGAFIVIVISSISDILVNNGISFARYNAQIGMFIFAFLETYALAMSYTNEIEKSKKLEKQNQKIYDKSIRDSLTKLYNRNYIEVVLDNMIENYKESMEVFTLLMFDIDHFKSINDKYGHLYGDKVLATVSDVIKKSLRKVDYVGRYGGEEFIAILPHTTKDKAKELAEKIRNNISDLYWDEDLKVTISGGVYENDSHAKIDCIKKADDLLYLAKENGRNRIETC